MTSHNDKNAGQGQEIALARNDLPSYNEVDDAQAQGLQDVAGLPFGNEDGGDEAEDTVAANNRPRIISHPKNWSKQSMYRVGALTALLATAGFGIGAFQHKNKRVLDKSQSSVVVASAKSRKSSNTSKSSKSDTGEPAHPCQGPEPDPACYATTILLYKCRLNLNIPGGIEGTPMTTLEVSSDWFGTQCVVQSVGVKVYADYSGVGNLIMTFTSPSGITAGLTDRDVGTNVLSSNEPFEFKDLNPKGPEFLGPIAGGYPFDGGCCYADNGITSLGKQGRQVEYPWFPVTATASLDDMKGELSQGTWTFKIANCCNGATGDTTDVLDQVTISLRSLCYRAPQNVDNSE